MIVDGILVDSKLLRNWNAKEGVLFVIADLHTFET